MRWDPTHILWGQQVMLMWILLPPIFIAAAAIPIVGPMLFRKGNRNAPVRREHGEAHASFKRG